MYELTFDEDLCATCATGDCLVKCQYLSFDPDGAREEMARIAAGEGSSVLTDCVTCYACEEYCGRGNHPFYLIARQQEALDREPLPRPLITLGEQMAVPWRGELKVREVSEPVLSLGVFPQLRSLIQGKLFEGVDVISEDRRTSFHLFCQLMYLHYGRTSLINERLPGVIDKLARHGAREVIFLHDECYGTYTHYARAWGIEVPFKPVHLFEFLHSAARSSSATRSRRWASRWRTSGRARPGCRRRCNTTWTTSSTSSGWSSQSVSTWGRTRSAARG